MSKYLVKKTVFFVAEIEADSYEEAVEEANYMDEEDMGSVEDDLIVVEEIKE